jgi:AraC-like DNA-binding protein
MIIMQKPFPHELTYETLRDMSSGVYPEMIRYTIDSSKSYFLYTEHRHFDHELICVTAGTYKAKLNGMKLELDTGDILIICPGDRHLDAVHEGLRYHAINFILHSDLFIDKTIRLFREDIEPAQQIVRSFSASLICDFKAIASEIKAPASLPKMVSSQLHAIFWRIVKQIPIERLSKEMIMEVSGNSFSDQLNRVISKNLYASALSVRNLATLMGMSPAKLTGLCAEHLNNSPAKLVLEARISTAKRLLYETDMSIKEISSLLNFSDQFTFSRAFKRRTGVSPREHRKQH